MDQKGIWNKVDPRDAQIMALTTMVETMEVNKKPSVHGNGGTVLSMNTQDAWQTKQPTIILSMVLLIGESRTSDH